MDDESIPGLIGAPLVAGFLPLDRLPPFVSTDATDRAVTIETRAELDDVLAASERVLVMVRTVGCTICKSMDPIIDNVARATDVAVVDFNPKTDLGAVEAFGVRSVPTFLLFEDGELVDRLADGFVPTADLVAFVERST